MESIKIAYLASKVISGDHHASNHLPDKFFDKENKAVIINIALIKNEELLTAPFYDELHFGNYE
jgi:hypothetical protein